MAAEDIRAGWWEAPAAQNWRCPECGQASPVEQWQAVEPYCEDCGSHDGRACPRCGEWFEHVWGAEKLEAADAPDPVEEAPADPDGWYLDHVNPPRSVETTESL